MQLPSPLGQAPFLPSPTSIPVFGLSTVPVINPLDPQWASSDRSSANDSSAWQRALDALGKQGGGIFFVPRSPAGSPWRVKGLVIPSGTSMLILGEAKGATSISAPKATPTIPMFDLTGRNGPYVHFQNLRFEGANFGLLESIAFNYNTTNGIRTIGCDFAGLNVAADMNTANSTDCAFSDCVLEGCSQAFRLNIATPTAMLFLDCVYVQNLQDFQITNADCSTLVHSRSASFQCSNTSILATGCTNLTIEDHKMDGATNGINLTGSQDTVLRNIRHIRTVTADYVNSGTFRVFADGCNGDLSPFIGAQLFCGSQRANKREMVSTAVPSSLSWNRGDIVRNSSPAVASPQGWVCTASGTPGTWVAMANL